MNSVKDSDKIVHKQIVGTNMMLAAEKATKDTRSLGLDKNTRSVEEQMTELQRETESSTTVAICDRARNGNPGRKVMP